MRTILILIVFLITSCNNDKIDRLESDVKEIKQSVERIEALLRGEGTENITSNSGTTTTPQGIYNNTTKKKKASSSGRCNAITKKGTQCSRSARSGGYCWQHGG